MAEPTEKETLLKDIANAEKSRLAAEADGNITYAEKLADIISAKEKRLLALESQSSVACPAGN